MFPNVWKKISCTVRPKYKSRVQTLVVALASILSLHHLQTFQNRDIFGTFFVIAIERLFLWLILLENGDIWRDVTHA